MICKVCGREIKNEEANFCEYCGASFRPGTNNKVSDEEFQRHTMYSTPFEKRMDQNVGAEEKRQSWSEIGTSNQPNANASSNSGSNGGPGQNPNMGRPGSFMNNIFGSNDKPMTFGNWMLIYMLPFIPMVGTILFLVILISWGFGSNVPESKKNWARATLVFGIIMIVVFVILVSSGMMGDYSTLLGNMTESGI